MSGAWRVSILRLLTRTHRGADTGDMRRKFAWLSLYLSLDIIDRLLMCPCFPDPFCFLVSKFGHICFAAIADPLALLTPLWTFGNLGQFLRQTNVSWIPL